MTHGYLDPFTRAEIHYRRVRLCTDWAAAEPRPADDRRRWRFWTRRPAAQDFAVVVERDAPVFPDTVPASRW